LGLQGFRAGGREAAAPGRRRGCAADAPCGALSGPSFALEVARGLPTALTLAAADAGLAETLARELHQRRLRVYFSDDVPGVEVGGAVKNVMAIATGIADGLGLGQNARAALITRGLAEVMRLGVVLGGRPETFMGLAGAGDLILTCTGDLSRNRRVGLALGRGERLEAILAQLGHVAEGVYTARRSTGSRAARGRHADHARGLRGAVRGRAPAEAVEQLLGATRAAKASGTALPARPGPRSGQPGSVLVLERELHPDAVGDHLPALALHVHLRDLGDPQVAERLGGGADGALGRVLPRVLARADDVDHPIDALAAFLLGHDVPPWELVGRECREPAKS
jgi:hypothetical protein